MCRNARQRASTEKPKHLNAYAEPFNPLPEAKASDMNTFKLPHHFYQHQPRLLLPPPPPPPPAAATSVMFSSPPFIRYHPIYYYNQICNYNVQFPINSSSNPLEKDRSERISGYPSGGFLGDVAAGGSGQRAAVTKRAVAKRAPRQFFGFKKEKTYVKCWRPKPHSSPMQPAAASPKVPSVDVSACGKTTIMIKNIPNQFRRNNLLDFLDRHCQENTDLQMEYDFVYLPMDFRTGDNLGYAFVNLTSTEAAVMMRAILYQYKWGLCKTTSGFVFESKKICEITWANIQGTENLVKHFKNSKFSCRNLEYLPVVLTPPRNGSSSLTVPTIIGNCLVSAPIEDGSGLGEN